MNIRRATLEDFDELYQLGQNTPELRVSEDEPFMDRDDFEERLKSKSQVFLLAESKEKVIGFILASTNDNDKPIKNKYACIVYIAVAQDARKKGVATALYDECTKELKKLGTTNIYTWADMNSGVIDFMKNKGFQKGKISMWMDKKLEDY